MAPFPPPSHPERIFSVFGVKLPSGVSDSQAFRLSTTKGWLFPPIPYVALTVGAVSRGPVYLVSCEWFSNTAAGTTPARRVGDRSTSYPMLRALAECSVQKPAASMTHGGWPCSCARSVPVTFSDTSMQAPPWSFRTMPTSFRAVPLPPAAPAPLSAPEAALCHARKPAAEYPDTPSDSNSTFGALCPAKSATR